MEERKLLPFSLNLKEEVGFDVMGIDDISILHDIMTISLNPR